MPYLLAFDQLDCLAGGRLTDISYTADRLWLAELDNDIYMLGQFLRLPPGQHVDAEESFLTSHLPYRRACFGGLDGGGDPWLFVIQAVPWSVARKVFGTDADPYQVMQQAMANALRYNAGARIDWETGWDRADLIGVYIAYADMTSAVEKDWNERGAEPPAIASWSTFDLLRGLLAELTQAELADLVAGYPHCAFPDSPHACQHDVFNDVLSSWVAHLRQNDDDGNE